MLLVANMVIFKHVFVPVVVPRKTDTITSVSSRESEDSCEIATEVKSAHKKLDHHFSL